MAGKIERFNSVTGSLSLTNSASTTAKIPFGPAAGGVIIVDAVSGAASINWHVAFGPELTPVPLNSDGAAATTSITVSNAYPIPDAAFAAPFVAPVLNAGTATIRVSLKG